MHGGHGDCFVEAFPAGFLFAVVVLVATGDEFGEEVGEGGVEVFGDGAGLAVLFGLEAGDLGEGLEGFGAPALDGEEVCFLGGEVG